MSEIKINLTKLPGSCIRTMRGQSGAEKPCIIIPLDSGLVVEDKSCYLLLQTFELTNPKGQTHFLKRKIHSSENLNYNDLPVIGGIK